MNELNENNNLLIYKNKSGDIIVDAIYKDETLWLTQKGMSKVFEVGIPAISKQLNKFLMMKNLTKIQLFPKWK